MEPKIEIATIRIDNNFWPNHSQLVCPNCGGVYLHTGEPVQDVYGHLGVPATCEDCPANLCLFMQFDKGSTFLSFHYVLPPKASVVPIKGKGTDV